MKNKYFGPRKLMLAIFAVAIFAGFGLVGIEKADAGSCVCVRKGPTGTFSIDESTRIGKDTKKDCLLYCSSLQYPTNTYQFDDQITSGGVSAHNHITPKLKMERSYRPNLRPTRRRTFVLALD